MRGHIQEGPETVADRFPVHEPPDVAVERPELLLHLEETAGVVDRSLDLQPIPDDPRIGEQSFQVPLSVPGHPGCVKTMESPAEIFPLIEDRPPAQPRPHAL